MYNLFMNLKTLKKILLFGKSRAFSKDEFESQMKSHNIEIVKDFDDDVSLVIDGRMMTPYEQNASDTLYEQKKINALSIDILEGELAKEIDSETLLMSLKLSHDKERLKSFIKNSCINDELFFRLIKMYKWSGEDFFENDDNRDVSAAFILRFYENIQRNHNVEFATTGYIHLVAQTTDIKLLHAIVELEPLKFHPKIKKAIAMSRYCDEKLQKKLYRLKDTGLNEALSLNKNLIDNIYDEFLRDKYLGANVAKSIILDDCLFEKCSCFSGSLTLNESLTLSMQKKLFHLNELDIYLSLAKNINLDEEILQKLIELDNEEILQNLYANSSTSKVILKEAYRDDKNHKALAKNENTPIEILYQLQLDGRYDRFVKTNAGYGRHIQSENIGWLV